MSHYPLVSIVMPSYQHSRFINQAAESVLAQDYDHIELVIQDGGSTDGTLDVLDRLAATDRRVRWLSETDNGPADAINRALARSRGTIIGWLNSDDLYTPGAIRRAVETLSQSPAILMCYGHGEHVDVNANNPGPYPTQRPDVGLEGFHSGCFICQPTVFFKRTMHGALGPLDVTSRTSFDFEYWLRAFSRFPDRIEFVDAVQAQSRLHDEAITAKQRRIVATEAVALTSRYLGAARPHWIVTHLEEISRATEASQPVATTAAEMSDFLNEISYAFPPHVIREMRQQIYLMVSNLHAHGRKGDGT